MSIVLSLSIQLVIINEIKKANFILEGTTTFYSFFIDLLPLISTLFSDLSLRHFHLHFDPLGLFTM